MPTPRSGRRADELRPLTFDRGYVRTAAGSVLVRAGGTAVICTASVDPGVPAWLAGKGRGWLTAEYAMLPASTRPRSSTPFSIAEANSRQRMRATESRISTSTWRRSAGWTATSTLVVGRRASIAVAPAGSRPPDAFVQPASPPTRTSAAPHSETTARVASLSSSDVCAETTASQASMPRAAAPQRHMIVARSSRRSAGSTTTVKSGPRRQ